MDICKVIGNVVSTNKTDGLKGLSLLIVRAIDLNTMELSSKTLVAVDTVGAGEMETVLVVTGSSARLTAISEKKPVDAAIIGIIDSIEIEKQRVYSKYEDKDTPVV
jgi:microcompartment protein CcmK/EutM